MARGCGTRRLQRVLPQDAKRSGGYCAVFVLRRSSVGECGKVKHARLSAALGSTLRIKRSLVRKLARLVIFVTGRLP